jgi:hypothetical protein
MDAVTLSFPKPPSAGQAVLSLSSLALLAHMRPHLAMLAHVRSLSPHHLMCFFVRGHSLAAAGGGDGAAGGGGGGSSRRASGGGGGPDARARRPARPPRGRRGAAIRRRERPRCRDTVRSSLTLFLSFSPSLPPSFPSLPIPPPHLHTLHLP